MKLVVGSKSIAIAISECPVKVTQLKDGFKVLKTYAQANLRYREARAQAEEARVVLDQALQSPPEPKAQKGKG